jgi:hypothetical protein
VPIELFPLSGLLRTFGIVMCGIVTFGIVTYGTIRGALFRLGRFLKLF